jgi:hypothetical protein
MRIEERRGEEERRRIEKEGRTVGDKGWRWKGGNKGKGGGHVEGGET